MDDSDYRKSVRLIARYLASDPGSNAAAVEDLVKQGRIVIAPDPDSLGLDAQSRPWIISEKDSSVAYVFTRGTSEKKIVNLLKSEILPIIAPEMHRISWWQRLFRR
ncbi:hypothetical protein [Pseudoxanthomonas suwonensis]|uniref:hypothetical protein n=1 Tax=Pseudoxanthomonas suwonensis TaxID=314722 RepID=UPI001186DE42|nr:hypothetical protein [Pseudoxanthomonas suwonensis]